MPPEHAGTEVQNTFSNPTKGHGFLFYCHHLKQNEKAGIFYAFITGWFCCRT